MTSPSPAPRLFLLSPAHCGGKRAAMLMNDRATFPLADRLRDGGTAPIGEVFAFLSGLYFRGKLTYARRFARAPAGVDGVRVITADRGLLSSEAPIGLDDLRAFGTVDIRADDPRYREPLERDVRTLALEPGEIVLLGSVATGKYVDVLLDLLSDRLRFPIDFVGRGDMSRGALLLNAARDGVELPYASAASSVRISSARINAARRPDR